MMGNESIAGLLILPRLRIQNANAISSPMTWGFPAITNLMGLTHAIERKLPEHINLSFEQVGVICHHFEPQVTEGGYTKAFHLTRNPVDKDGSTAAIVEEGRVHLEITLVFAVGGDALNKDDSEKAAVADEVATIVSGMRVAGGTVLPFGGYQNGCRRKPLLRSLSEDSQKREEEFRKIRRRWLPGFALVSRDDLLQERWAELKEEDGSASMLDAWLDLSRMHHYPVTEEAVDETTGELSQSVKWHIRRPPGWIVPIPVGFGAISSRFDPGDVTRARDSKTCFRFVESLYSIGQWVSPHRLRSLESLLWYPQADSQSGLYRCANDFTQSRQATD